MPLATETEIIRASGDGVRCTETPQKDDKRMSMNDATVIQVDEQDGAHSSSHLAPELVEEGRDDEAVYFEATTTASEIHPDILPGYRLAIMITVLSCVLWD